MHGSRSWSRSASTVGSVCPSRFLAVLSGVLLMTGGSMAWGQGEVYQWTDERGVIHFSDSTVPRQYLERAEVRPNRKNPTPRPREASAWRIPLESRDGKKYVRVVLEGLGTTRDVRMLVDTGAQISMIDEALADDLRLEFVEDAGIVGVTGIAPGWIGKLRRLRVEDRELRDWRVMVGPLPGMYLLGMDVLDQLGLTVATDALEGR